jgi:hypothetical protein
MNDPVTYCGAWHEGGPATHYICRHIGATELDQLHERARTNGIAAGIRPDSPELDRFIEAQLLATLPLIDAQRDAAAQTRPSLRVVKE